MKLDATNRYIAHINPQAAGYKNTEVEPLYQSHRRPLPRHSRRSQSRPRHLHANGGEQLGIWRQSSGRAGPEQRRVLGERHPGVLRLRRHACRHGSRLHVAGHAACAARRRRQSGIRQAVLRQTQSHRPSLWLFRSGQGRPQDGAHEIVGVVEDTTYTSVYWKNHAMYFLPLTQRAGNAKDPDNPLEKDQSMYAGAMVIQTSRILFPALKRSSATPWRASIPTSPS